jgi:hypothetical protein
MGDAHTLPPASRYPHHGAPRFFGSGTWGGGASAQAGGVAGHAGLPAATGVLSPGVVAGHGAPGGAARYQPVASKDSMHVSSSAYDASALQLLPPQRRGASQISNAATTAHILFSKVLSPSCLDTVYIVNVLLFSTF